MGPGQPPSRPPRAPKSRTLREGDWDEVKPYIIQYLKTRTLCAVINDIETQFGFIATERQYKSALKRWKIGKNVTRQEMKAIVRKQQFRNLAEPEQRPLTFRVRGEIVAKRKIDRFMRQEGINHDVLYCPSSGASTPNSDEFSCQTAPETLAAIDTTLSYSDDVAATQQVEPPAMAVREPSLDLATHGVLSATLSLPPVHHDPVRTDLWSSVGDTTLDDIQISSRVCHDVRQDNRGSHQRLLMMDAAGVPGSRGLHNPPAAPEASDNERLAFYQRVLESLVAGKTGQERTRLVQEFQDVIGLITLLAEPVGISLVADLLNCTSVAISDKLAALHPAIDVHSFIADDLFRNFLSDQGRGVPAEFWLDEQLHHRKIASRCLTLLSRLQRDICDLNNPGSRRRDVDEQQLERRLPPSVRYACLHWIHHLVRGKAQVRDGDETHTFLQNHFLHWLEALCLLGQASKILDIFRPLRLLIKSGYSIELTSFISDAESFISNCISIIEAYPLQLYSSAIVFCGESSSIRRLFAHEVLSVLARLPRVGRPWNPCIRTLNGHEKRTSSVSFSHDSRLLATGSYDKTVKIWDTATWKCLRTLVVRSLVATVIFSHDSSFLVVVADRNVDVWHTATWRRAQSWGSESEVRCFALSHNSRLFAWSETYGTIEIKDVLTGRLLHILTGTKDSHSVVFSHDSTLLASCDGGDIKIWHTESGQCIQTLESTRYSHSIIFSHDSRMLAWVEWTDTECDDFFDGDDDDCIRIWDMVAFEFLQIIKPNQSRPVSLVFSHDSSILASASLDSTVRLWDASTGQCLQVYTGHSGFMQSVAFSHDSSWLASGSFDDTVKIWDVKPETYQIQPQYAGWNKGDADPLVSLSPDTELVASASLQSGSIRIWNATTGECLQRIRQQFASTNWICFSQSPYLLVAECRPGIHNIWHTTTGTCIQTVVSAHTSVSFSHNSQLLALPVKSSGSLDIWHVATGLLLDTLHDCQDDIAQTMISYDSRLVACVSKSGTIHIWNIARGELTRRLEVCLSNDCEMSSPAFSDDSQLLASACLCSIKIWDIESGRCLQTMRPPFRYTTSWNIASLTISRNSKLLASLDHQTVNIWAIETGYCLRTLSFDYRIYKVSFDPTSRFIHTNLGVVALDLSLTTETADEMIQRPRFQGYWLSSDQSWVMHGSDKVLWLHPHYRRRKLGVAIEGSTVAISSGSEEVLIFQLADCGIV
ncbi:hypothetical protein H634G_08074 [Metarhizium anisopliae BRIP 53293]|uniref:Clr5 domain-containing protein n=1 Tax=Metarhizium anisopliae BRIP 53293 TaxID=1291518 RepID=A0A0D9NRE5_METAN|nr:hypothetical protein H634G_08074 [Metarhizium anisopliae BRIP 53293]KJK95028.1 hypothetical protein H633G_01120 [Metarhizium anisopliae BRIP 53284]